jgi:hypothetical protein
VLNLGQPIGGEDWRISIVNTIQFSIKKNNWNVFGVVCLGTLKAHQKKKGEFKLF